MEGFGRVLRWASIGFNRQRRHFDRKGGFKRKFGPERWVCKGIWEARNGFGWVFDQMGGFGRVRKGLEGRASMGFNRQRRHFERKGGIKRKFGPERWVCKGIWGQEMGLEGFSTRWVGLERFGRARFDGLQ